MVQGEETHQLQWKNGNQPWSTRFGDTFYSLDDGRAETRHVFIEGNNLSARWRTGSDCAIGELGFGTGLNFLETWLLWKQVSRPDQKLTFVSVEAYPLAQSDMKKALGAWPELSSLANQLIDSWEGARKAPVLLEHNVSLQVVEFPVLTALDNFPTDIDAWFLDGFSPAQNQDMWSKNVMEKIAALTATNGTFASYTCAGWVRRNLVDAGFKVGKYPGFGRKREMIAGYLESTT